MRVKVVTGQFALGAAMILAVSADPARAQQVAPAPEAAIPERQSVLQRARPDYDPLGIRLGSFLAYPTARLAETFDSNVFATTNGTKNDFYTTLNPGIAVRSDWNVHSVAFQASSETKRYASLVSENVTNFLVNGNGRLDILRDIYARGGAGYQLLHEDRDRIVYAINSRVSYEIVPGYHAFVQAIGNERDYVRKTDQRGFHRSSHGYEADVGTAIDVSHVINGEVYAGYLSQMYED